jgi:hypothetical protein
MFDWSLKPRQSFERLTTGSPSNPLDVAIAGRMLEGEAVLTCPP